MPGTGGRHYGRTAAAAAFCLLSMAAMATPAAADQVVHLFNASPSMSYTVEHNGSPWATLNSTTAGSLVFTGPASPGDRFRIYATGGGATPPTVPIGLSGSGDEVGCAHLSWNANPETDVVLYRIYYGSASGVYTDSTQATGVAADICGLTDGTWFFAVRAYNTAGMLSGLSIEVSASVSNGNAQPPAPPVMLVVREGDPGCADMLWNSTGDPSVVGYTVDYGTASVASGAASEYDVSMDVGSTPAFSVCQLPAGTWYFAVRAKNHLGLLSTYSPEMSLTITSTPVLISTFDASVEGQSVTLQWQILADEMIRGLRVLRAGGGRVEEPITGLLSSSETRYVDHSIEPDTRYTYTLLVVGENGGETRSTTVDVHTNPLALALEQNYPNPFNPSTTIAYVLPSPGDVQMTVYDVRGQLVAILIDGRSPAGRSTVAWDGRDTRGRLVASGTYFCRIRTPEGVRTRKMVMLK